ncbi:MAG: hypothetical protein QXS66_02520 [Thermoproteota archaeon]|nr:hypothetical protein [Candidatus Brockarchaeota archaeon]
MTNSYKWQRAGLIIFSISVGIIIAAFLRGISMTESVGAVEEALGPLLIEPKEMHFAVTDVQPEVSMNIEVLRLSGETVLRFNNVPLKEFEDMSWLERGLYVFSIKTSDNKSSIQNISFTFVANKPPRDMVILSIILGLIGTLIFFIPMFMPRVITSFFRKRSR